MSSSRGASGKRIVVVLGMHRSGTSAVARGLLELGVDLGDDLMPPAAGNNEKGFWEDLGFNRLNIDLLEHLGLRWDSLTPIPLSEFDRQDLAPFRLRASKLLRKKLEGVSVFGFKDPHASQLQPFWQSAFAEMGLDVSYVISVRHPLSVAQSLKARDGFEAGKSYYLWLDNVMASMLDSRGSPRVVVGYDLLMSEPEAQLRRIAKALALPFDPKAPRVAEYTKEFLTENLRHSVFALSDLQAAPDVPAEVVQAYALLDRMARGKLSVESKLAGLFFERTREILDGMRPALAFMTHKDREAREGHEEIENLKRDLHGRGLHVTHLESVVVEREGHIADLDRAVGERNARIASLQQDLDGRALHVAHLESVVVERVGRIASLVQRFRAELAEDAADARAGALRIARTDFRGAAPPPALEAARLALERWAADALAAAERLGQADPTNPDADAIPEFVRHVESARRGNRDAIAQAAESLGRSLVDSQRELEINRLRLLDSLREVSRQAVLAGARADELEAEVRARDAAILEQHARIDRLGAILGQTGHRFVTRVGEALGPHPGVQSVIRTTLRTMLRLIGKTHG